MIVLIPQEFTYVIAKSGRKQSKSIKPQSDKANELLPAVDDNHEQVYTEIIAAN